MKSANFKNGSDTETFAPFILDICQAAGAEDYRLIFANWEWLEQTMGADNVDDYYLNGYGVQNVVKAARLHAGLEPTTDNIEYNSEGDTCYIQFMSLEEACVTAELAQSALLDGEKLRALVALARRQGLEE